MGNCEVWDVVKVPFPYTNRSVQQHRPALVVARHGEAGSPALLWVLMITSASHRRWIGDVDISDLTLTGLPAASVIRSAKIATVEALDAERIGYLPPTDRGAVRMAATKLVAGAIHNAERYLRTMAVASRVRSP